MSYDINFWRQEAKLRKSPETIYHQLSEGKAVKGLAKLPVESILGRLSATLPGFNSDNTLVSLSDGSIEISWSDHDFRFDLRGHVPDEVRESLITVMSEFDCPLYDPQLNVRYATPDGLQVVEPQATDDDTPTVIQLLQMMAAEAGFTLPPLPEKTALQPVDEDADPISALVPAELADNASEAELEQARQLAKLARSWLQDISRQSETLGFKLIGDFSIPEAFAQLRAFFRAPSSFLCAYQHLLGHAWIEWVVLNEDDSMEICSTWALDATDPPWVKRHVNMGTVLDLDPLMRKTHSGKAPASVSADGFAERFTTEYERHMSWRKTRQ